MEWRSEHGSHQYYTHVLPLPSCLIGQVRRADSGIRGIPPHTPDVSGYSYERQKALQAVRR